MTRLQWMHTATAVLWLVNFLINVAAHEWAAAFNALAAGVGWGLFGLTQIAREQDRLTT